jgi:hypothetical protein
LAAAFVGAFGGIPPYVSRSLAIDPQDSDTIYAGLAGSGVFKSTDTGSFGNYITALAIDSQSPSTVYVAAVWRILKTANWREVVSGLTVTSVRSLAIARTRTVYAPSDGRGISAIVAP